MLGINLSGAEFGRGNRYGYDYIYPSAQDIDFYADRGLGLTRLPIKWERVQPVAGGPLDQQELARIKDFLAHAEAEGASVIIDLHNYGRYKGAVLGSAGATIGDFAKFWSDMAAELKGYSSLLGYGLMNEPHDMGSARAWPMAAQAAVDAIRAVDHENAIFVAGDAWSSAAKWAKANAQLKIVDPADNLFYEAHVYFDKDGSGTYKLGYEGEGATPMTGVNRLQPFLDWLDANDAKGFVGEFAVPNDDPRWLPVLDNFIAAMAQHDVSGTYWGAGPWWGDYPLALRAKSGAENPQLDILEAHVAAEAGIAGTEPIHDLLRGSARADTLKGGDGDERIEGLAGNDRLIGGLGHDLLVGGAGKDVFAFTRLGESSPAAPDEILDFVRGQDRIGLHQIDAKAGGGANDKFLFIGTDAFSGRQGELRYELHDQAGTLDDRTMLLADWNGDRIADFSIQLHGIVPLSQLDLIC